MRKVLILQEYIPHYRLPFFVALTKEASKVGIEIRIAYGDSTGSNSPRRDAVQMPGGIQLAQREWRIAGRRLTLRRLPTEAASADMLVYEQARRNLDLYRVILPTIKRGRRKIALWGHGRDYTKASSAVEVWLQRKLILAADWFFAYTEGAKDAVALTGFDQSKVTVVQNSIDTSELRRSVEQVDAITARRFDLEYDLKGKTALFLGALDSSKRLGFLEEASLIAARLDSNFRLLIGGDGPLREQVEIWARSKPFVSYLGTLSGPAKALALASSQVIAMPGRVGLAAVDSFAAGVPMVTTCWPWHAPEFEYLVSGRNALITADDPEAYATSMVELLGDPDQLDCLVAHAASDAATYTIEEMVRRFLAGVSQALGDDPK